MVLCAGVKRDGGRCTATVEPPQSYCWWHAPENAEKRRRMASKAAKAKPNRELRDIKGLLSDLTERVLAGKLETGPAAVANQLINTRLRAIEQERKAIRDRGACRTYRAPGERPGAEGSNKMATNLETRVRNLEAAGGRGECPECGFAGDWSKAEIVTRVNEKVPGPDNCPECSRPLVIRVSGLGKVR